MFAALINKPQTKTVATTKRAAALGPGRVAEMAAPMRVPPRPLQRKRLVGGVDDPLEYEADHIAEHVMRMPEAAMSSAPLQLNQQVLQISRANLPMLARSPCSCGGSSPRCAPEADDPGAGVAVQAKREGRSQAVHFGTTSGGQEIAPHSVNAVLSSPGQRLDETTRRYFEPRFGHDFSRVRVHSDQAAARSARELNARAYVVGHHMVFGAGQYALGTAEGKRLVAHELTHVLQQGGGRGGRIQRAPVGGAATTAVKALEPLEEVAQRIARLATGPSSAPVNLKGGPGKVVSAVRNMRTGQIYVGLNTGTPATLTEPIDAAIEAQRRRIAAGEVKVVHTAVDAIGGHAEVNALNTAIADEQAALGRAMTADEIAATFEMHNVWLSGGKRALTTAARCEHCAAITRGVKVSQSQFKAEGGVSGEIHVPQSGKAVLTGGKTVEADTIHGEIQRPKPSIKPTTRVPERVPEAVPEVKVAGVPSVGKSVVRLVVTEIAVNVLLFAVSYYLEKWHAEKQARKFNNDLKGLLPELNKRLQGKEAEIVEKQKAFPLVYGTITIGYTHDKYVPEDYNEGSMSIQGVAISHQNYQTPEKLIRSHNPWEDNDPAYWLTFSVPLFDEETAEKGASSWVRNYRQMRANLIAPAYTVRFQAVAQLFKLAKDDSSLETLVVRDLLGMLKDEDAMVRQAAALFLMLLKAKIAIQYIREVIPITSDDKQRELIQSYLRELEQG